VERLFDRRLVLVTGKGGVGKTTVAAALSLLAARKGQRVLVCEVDGPSAVAPLLGGGATSHQPRPVAGGVHLAVLSPEEGLRGYLAERIHVPGLVDLALKNPVIARFFRATPAVPEMSVLYAIAKLLEERDGDRPRWDQVVVDLPASGHAMALLGAPFTGKRVFRAGPLHHLCVSLERMLTDPAHAAVAVVTLPEELPVNEALDLVGRLKALGVPVETVLANAVAPEPFDRAEQDLIGRLLEAQPRPLLQGAAAAARRGNRAAVALRRLTSGLSREPVRLRFRASRGFDLVRAVADELAAHLGVRRHGGHLPPPSSP
jgi:anion-transporting  ArsA/GET3 family ATPase